MFNDDSPYVFRLEHELADCENEIQWLESVIDELDAENEDLAKKLQKYEAKINVVFVKSE